jgi:CheY-like chemotaxis protein
MNRRAVIVEDELLVALYLEDVLADLDWEVCGIAASAESAVTTVLAQRPTLVLMDVRLKGIGDGVDAAHRIRGDTACPIIFVTGSSEPVTLARIQAVPGATVLIKPILADQLRRAIAEVVGEEEVGRRMADDQQG